MTRRDLELYRFSLLLRGGGSRLWGRVSATSLLRICLIQLPYSSTRPKYCQQYILSSFGHTLGPFQRHRDQMSSSSTFHGGPCGGELQSTESRALTAFSSHSLHADCPIYTSARSSADLSWCGRTLSECASCLSEPDIAGCCPFRANAEERQNFLECVESSCTEAICDECSDTKEYCGDCIVDCGPDCDFSFGCSELDIRVDDPYSFEGSQSELFGDQTAQTFGFGRNLPQLTMENTVSKSCNFGKDPDCTTISILPGYGTNQSYSGSIRRQHYSSQMSLAPNTRVDSLGATVPSHAVTAADTSPLTCNTASLIHSSDSAPGSPDRIDSTASAHHDHINLFTVESDSRRHILPSLLCQWADSNGKPCGKALEMGNDMHEHLKSAHGVRNEVFCRWVGCSSGVWAASPHRFASSVERHTWGHSGYRPYKCSACNEGFAAASVRDEHYTNIHLRKKVFSCDMCSHQCTSITNLKRHKDDKHSVERFQCEFCNQSGKRRLFPRGPNLARHLRSCKYALAQFPEAGVAGKANVDWLPPGYKRGHRGMDRAKVTPPNYLPAQNDG